MAESRIEMPGADVVFYLSSDLGAPPDLLFERLRNTIPWAVRQIRIAGRMIEQPRATSWHGDPDATYTYSRTLHEPAPWTPELTLMRRASERLAGSIFNSVLLNLYFDEQSSMGFHADDEPELGDQPIIVSISLGAPREFRFRPRRGRPGKLTKLLLPHGSVLVMRGDTQKNWLHGIEKSRAACGERINLTFRHVGRTKRQDAQHSRGVGGTARLARVC